MAKREMITPPNNSFKVRQEAAKEEREPVEMRPGSVMETKKTLGRKLAETFLSEDSHTVTSYIFSDVIVPMLKDLITGAIKQGTDVLFYGRSGGGGSSSKKNYTSASYQSWYYGGNKPQAQSGSNVREPSEITFDTYRLATEVLEEMRAVVEQYHNLSILDYHDIVEQVTGFCPSSSWADRDYGWTDLSRVEPRVVRGGRYILTLPKAVPIRRD